jgi:hypothetical protein
MTRIALLVALAALLVGVDDAFSQVKMFEGIPVDARRVSETRGEGEKRYLLYDGDGQIVARLVDLPGDPTIVSGNPLAPLQEFPYEHDGVNAFGEHIGRAERAWTSGAKLYRDEYERAIVCWGYGSDERRRAYVLYTSSCLAWQLRVRLDEFMRRGIPDAELAPRRPAAT